MAQPEHYTLEENSDGTLYVTINGDSSDMQGAKFKEAALSFLHHHVGESFNAMVDLRNTGTATVSAVRDYAQVVAEPQLNRIAFIVKNQSVRPLLDLALLFAHKKNISVFENASDARNWLFDAPTASKLSS